MLSGGTIIETTGRPTPAKETSLWSEWILLDFLAVNRSVWLELPLELNKDATADVLVPALPAPLLLTSASLQTRETAELLDLAHIQIRGPYRWIAGRKFPSLIHSFMMFEEKVAKLLFRSRNNSSNEKNGAVWLSMRIAFVVCAISLLQFGGQLKAHLGAAAQLLPQETVKVDDARELRFASSKSRRSHPIGAVVTVTVPTFDERKFQVVLTGVALGVQDDREVVVQIDNHEIASFPEDLFCTKEACLINAPVPQKLLHAGDVNAYVRHTVPESPYAIKEVRWRLLPVASSHELAELEESLHKLNESAHRLSYSEVLAREKLIDRALEQFSRAYFPPRLRKVVMQLCEEQSKHRRNFVNQSIDDLRLRLKSGQTENIDAEIRRIEELLSSRERDLQEDVERLRRHWNEVKT